MPKPKKPKAKTKLPKLRTDNALYQRKAGAIDPTPRRKRTRTDQERDAIEDQLDDPT